MKKELFLKLGAGLSLALIGFFAPSAWADGVSTSESDLLTPTLTGLRAKSYTDSDGKSATYDANLTSAYELTDVTTEVANDLDKYGNYIGTAYDFVVKKYLDDGEGNLITKYYSLSVSTQGTGSNTLYYAWSIDETGNKTLVEVASEADADFAVKYDGDLSYSTPDVLAERLVNTSSSTDAITTDYIELTNSTADVYTSVEGTSTSYLNTFTNKSYVFGAIYNSTASASLAEISGDFKGNSVYSSIVGDDTSRYIYAYAQGGGIYNEGSISSINGSDFVNNSVTASSYSALYTGYATPYAVAYATGGAIANVALSTASIGSITGNFIGNSAKATSESHSTSNNFYGINNYAQGGAIYNYAYGSSYSNSTYVKIGAITGDFIANYVETSTLGTALTTSTSYLTEAAEGGAIYNYVYYSYVTIDSITGTFTANYASSKTGSSSGGAIYNYANRGDITIGDITGDFIANYVISSSGSAYGGAIYNYITGYSSSKAYLTMGDITGDFIGNYAYSTSSGVQGGAIYAAINTNSSGSYGTLTMGDITGDFIGNYVHTDTTLSGSNYAHGGAIFINTNTTNSSVSIDSITGDFIGNYAYSNSSYSRGGAIYIGASSSYSSNSLVKSITGDFIGNYTVAGSTTHGGAIYNEGTINSITGDFIGNYGEASTSYGGAIYADGGTISLITGDFIGNYVSGNLATGGALYLSTGSEITTVCGDFIYNYAYASTTSSSSNVNGGAIYAKEAYLYEIEGDFTGNFIEATNATAQGGAIYLNALKDSIDYIEGDFTGNYTSAYSANGGAFFIAKSTIDYIKGDFTGNYASGVSANGGAFALDNNSNTTSTALVSYVEGNFEGNYAAATTGDALGGAIYNYAASQNESHNVDSIAEFTKIVGSFDSNYASSEEGTALGGAIYNVGSNVDNGYTYSASIGSVEGDFTNNYAMGVTALGGAVYTSGSNATITFKASDTDGVGSEYSYTGNWAGTSKAEASDENGGFLYITNSAEATFDIDELSSIEIGEVGVLNYDSIAGDGTITKTGDGELIVNSSMQYFTGSLYVEEGDMYYTSSAGLSLALLDIDSGATFYTSASSLSNISSILNDGTISLNGGSLASTLAGAIDISGTVESSTIITTSSLSVSATGELSINASDISASSSVSNAGTITLTDGTLTSDITDNGDNTVVNISSSEENTTTISASLSADDINITGTVVVTDDLGTLIATTIDIDSDASLTSNASNLNTSSITNAGDLTLTGGTLSSSINYTDEETYTAQGNLYITDNVLANSDIYVATETLTISSEVIFDISADNLIVGSIDNDGEIVLDGTLDAEISGDGAITVESGTTLVSDADNLGQSVYNEGTVDLTDGTLSSVITTADESAGTSVVNITNTNDDSTTISASVTASDININGTVVVSEDGVLTSTNSIDISTNASLESNANSLNAVSITTDGTIILTGGTLDTTISEGSDTEATGSIIIAGEVDTNASNLGVAVTNEGELTLTSGTLSVTITGDTDDASDSVIIDGTVLIANASDDEEDSDITSSGYISASTLTINDLASLTTNAANLDVDSLVNNGDLVITGGTLDTEISGDGDLSVSGDLSTDAVNLKSDIEIADDVEFTITGDEDTGSGALDSEVSGDGDIVIAGEITSSKDISGDTFTVSTGQSFVAAENTSITITADEYVLEDGATIEADTLTNVHSEGDTGIIITVSGSAEIIGDVIANSPITYTVKDSDYDSATNSITQTGDVSTVGTDEDAPDYGIVTINGLTLNLTGTISTGYQYAVEASVEDAAAASAVVIENGAVLNFVVEAQSDASMVLFNDVGTITESSDSIKITGYADTAATGELIAVADEATIENNGGIENFYNNILTIDNDDLLIDASYEGLVLSYMAADNFSEQAETANEEALAEALEDVDSSTAIYADDLITSTAKLAVEASGLGAYLMNSYSYIAEVDTMLLSNQNFANVNRARAILDKSAVYVDVTEAEIVEDATGVSIESEEIAAIKYSNVAQLQVISFLGNKDASNGVAGYDYYSVGATANFDKIFSENAMAGVSIGGVYNKIDGDAGDNANSTAFLLNAYGVIKSGKYPFELFANLGYAHFWNEGSNSISKADWDSDAFNALAGIAFEFETGVNGLTINPLAMLNFVALNSDSASYSNGIDVDSQNYISAKIMAGLELEYAMTAQFNATLRAMYAYELGDDSYDYTYGIANGSFGSINYLGGEAGRNSAVLGLSLSYDFSETCSAYFDYNAYIYSELITHSLNLSVGLKF